MSMNKNRFEPEGLLVACFISPGQNRDSQQRAGRVRAQVASCGCWVQFWKIANKTADCVVSFIIVVSVLIPIWTGLV